MRVDLNADLAERGDPTGWEADARLLEVVTTANVACGGHAGDGETMRRACALAAEFGVRVGAHPGYEDTAGFGRVELDLPVAQIVGQVGSQLAALEAVATTEGAALSHVKPHGALYHRAAADRELAASLAGLVASVDPSLAILTQPGSMLASEARALGLVAASEGYADRAYDRNGRLVPRDEPGSVLDAASAVGQALLLAREGRVVSADGEEVPVSADSICVHGDTPDSAQLARTVRAALEGEGLAVGPFA